MVFLTLSLTDDFSRNCSLDCVIFLQWIGQTLIRRKLKKRTISGNCGIVTKSWWKIVVQING